MFLINVQNAGLRKNDSKFCHPTHALPQTPSTTLYCLNAITRYDIGTYLKITKYANGRITSRYSCQCRRRLRFHLAPTVCRLTPAAGAGSATVTSHVCRGPIASLPLVA